MHNLAQAKAEFYIDAKTINGIGAQLHGFCGNVRSYPSQVFVCLVCHCLYILYKGLCVGKAK